MGRSPTSACWAGLLALWLLTTACQSETSKGDVALRLGGQDIPYSQFEEYLRDLVNEKDLSLEEEVLSRLFDQFIDELLLTRLAWDRGLVEADAEERQVLAALLRGLPEQDWPQAQIESYYEAHAPDFARPERVRLRQILTNDKAVAEEARRALAAGEDFAQVAARLSQEPMAHLGGSQGWLSREDLPPVFVDTIFALGPGEVSDIVTADYGYHIFQVVEREEAEVVPLARVEDEIRQIFERRQVDEQVAAFINDARQRYDVQVFLSNLPFNYRGSYVENSTQASRDSSPRLAAMAVVARRQRSGRRPQPNRLAGQRPDPHPPRLRDPEGGGDHRHPLRSTP